MILYYVRHGDPIYSPDSLTKLGHEQAKALSKRMAKFGLDEIYSSTSIRARMTAEPTCKIIAKVCQLQALGKGKSAKIYIKKRAENSLGVFFAHKLTLTKTRRSKNTKTAEEILKNKLKYYENG